MQPISDGSFHELIRVMEGYRPLSIKFKTALKLVLFEEAYQKGARVLVVGQTQQRFWFMLSGLARENKVDGITFKVRTKWFWVKYDFVFTTPGFFSQEPSEREIEVLDDSVMIWFSYGNWKILRERFGEAELITEKIRSSYEKIRLQHMEKMESWTTEERYLGRQDFLESLMTRTKLKYVAEFMGMASDTLGKLRKKYSGRK